MTIDRPRQEMETEIERLRERCEAYKGQVEAGAHEIGRLRARNEQLEAALTIARDAVASGDSDIGTLNQIDAVLDPEYGAKLAALNSSITPPAKEP